jgi:dTDP-4-dehydrorhamnose reductase
MKVLILGGSGLLGSTLAPGLRKAGRDVLVHSREQKAQVQADLTQLDSSILLLEKTQPDCILNLVCLSDVDACERDVSAAYRLNVNTLENVCVWLKSNPQTKLIHISTDHLYDSAGPSNEDDVHIKNVYALSKYCAEKVALEHGGCVLRTNFFGTSRCEGRRTFSEWVINSLRDGTEVTLFDDVVFSPLRMETLTRVIDRLLANFSAGLFNVGSREGLSKSNFALSIAKRLSLSTESVTIGSILSSGLSARPMGMLMDSSKFEQTFSLTLPTLSEEIEEYCLSYL